MDKHQALQRYIKSQEAMKAVLASIPDEQKSSLEVEGTWTVKEVLCHFIGWDKTLLEPLEVYLALREFPVKVIQDHDLHNAKQTSSRQDWPLQKVLEKATQTSQQLIVAVSQLDSAQSQVNFPAPWGGESTIPEMLAGLAWHVDDHLKRVIAAIQ